MCTNNPKTKDSKKSKKHTRNKPKKEVAVTQNDQISNEELYQHFDNFIKKFFANIKEYKDVYTIICTATGLIMSTFWKLACNFGYYGYASALNIDMQYVNPDTYNILITFLMIVGIAAFVIYPIFCWAKKSVANKKRFFITLGICITFVIAPFALICLYQIFKTWTWISHCILIVIFMAILSVAFLLAYVSLYISLLPPSNKNVTRTSEQDIANNKNSSSETRNISKLNNTVKAVIWFAVGILSLLIAIYFFGAYTAKSNTEYKIIVNSYEYSLVDEQRYNVILSETNDSYYIVQGQYAKDENNCTSLTLYTDCYTLRTKDESIFIAQKRFDDVNIK